MPAAATVSPARYAPSRRDRAVSFVLAVLVGVSLIAVLVMMTGVVGGGSAENGQLVAVNIAPPSADKDKQKAAPKQDVKQEQVQTVTTPPPKLPPHVEIPSKNQVEWPPGFIKLSREDIAKADISRIKPAGGGGAAGAATMVADACALLKPLPAVMLSAP
jgi:protein TonB